MAAPLGGAVRDTRTRRRRQMAEVDRRQVLPRRELGGARRLRRRQLGAALPPHVGRRQATGRRQLGGDRSSPAPLLPRPAPAHEGDAPGGGRRQGGRAARRARRRRRQHRDRGERGGRRRRRSGRQPRPRAQGVARQPRLAARAHPHGLALLRRRRDARRGEAHRRERHPHRPNVELRRRRPPPRAEAPAARAEADPSALGCDARPDRPPLRPRPGDADVRRLLRARAHVRGRPQVLVARLQLEDRRPRAGCVRRRAQPGDP